MAAIAYTVAVTFPDAATAEEFLRWLRHGHIAAVLVGGATTAEIVLVDGPALHYEIHYRFPSREAFDRYERESAPQLRAEGLRLFPTDKGIVYRRSVGSVLDVFPSSS